MKFACLFAVAVRALDGGDGGTPHDPEAMAFCQGKTDGFYQDVKDCASYFFCWNQGMYRGHSFESIVSLASSNDEF